MTFIGSRANSIGSGRESYAAARPRGPGGSPGPPGLAALLGAVDVLRGKVPERLPTRAAGDLPLGLLVALARELDEAAGLGPAEVDEVRARPLLGLAGAVLSSVGKQMALAMTISMRHQLHWQARHLPLLAAASLPGQT